MARRESTDSVRRARRPASRAARRIPALLLAVAGIASSATAADCGTLLSVSTHAGTSTRVAYVAAPSAKATTLVLLPGDGGRLDLDAAGCPQALVGNSLVRMAPLFQAAGFATALVDAPSDYQGEAGLAGFRIAEKHADDLGKVIAEIRNRSGGAVWLIGTSRGSISAANAASRLTGAQAPDGLVLTSPVTSGFSGGQKAWVAQTVFDLPLEAIRMPTLLVAHASDRCLRTPPERIAQIDERIGSARKQSVTVSGGPGWPGPVGTEACRGRSPHGFVEQEAEVAAGIARFVAGERY